MRWSLWFKLQQIFTIIKTYGNWACSIFVSWHIFRGWSSNYKIWPSPRIGYCPYHHIGILCGRKCGSICKHFENSGCKWDNTSRTHLFFYCFYDCFLGNSPRIFLKKILKNLYTIKKNSSYYFIKVHVNIFKKIQIHLQVLLLLKNNHYNV